VPAVPARLRLTAGRGAAPVVAILAMIAFQCGGELLAFSLGDVLLFSIWIGAVWLLIAYRPK
jgi:hypothetical protein